VLSAIADSSNAGVDWTSVIVAAIGALASAFAAYMASQASKQSRQAVEQARQNNLLLKTNSGKTIGEHIEELQADQIVLRGELARIAEDKLKADAALAAASLEAVAKLTAAADLHIQETASATVEALLAKADKTAHTLTKDP